MISFTAIISDSAHYTTEPRGFQADDIDHAAEQAIDSCAADEFVIAVFESEYEILVRKAI